MPESGRIIIKDLIPGMYFISLLAGDYNKAIKFIKK